MFSSVLCKFPFIWLKHYIRLWGRAGSVHNLLATVSAVLHVSNLIRCVWNDECWINTSAVLEVDAEISAREQGILTRTFFEWKISNYRRLTQLCKKSWRHFYLNLMFVPIKLQSKQKKWHSNQLILKHLLNPTPL